MVVAQGGEVIEERGKGRGSLRQQLRVFVGARGERALRALPVEQDEDVREAVRVAMDAGWPSVA